MKKNLFQQLETHGKISIKENIDEHITSRTKVVKTNINKYRIEVEITNNETGKKIRHQKTVVNSEIIDATVETLKRQSLDSNKTTKLRNKSQNKEEFKRRVDSVPGIYDPKSYGISPITQHYLAKSTIKQAVTYFRDTIGAMYIEYGTYDVSLEEQKKYQDKLIEKIYSSQNLNSKGGTSLDEVANGVYTKWNYAEKVRAYCDKYSEYGPWPEQPLLQTGRISTGSKEHLKIIPYNQFLLCVFLILEACKEGIAEAFGAAGMVFCGMRVGESTALSVGQFEMMDNGIGRYYIDSQIDQNGEVTDKLKNDYSYRYAFIFALMADIWQLKKEQLKSVGYDESIIKKAYLASEIKAPTAVIRKERVSRFLKDLLIAAGSDPKNLEAAEKAIMGEAGRDVDHDICAHLFRRNFATISANGGIPTNVVDALLGHENKKNKREDYAAWEKAEEIVGMLNRCFNFGNSTKIINPAYKTIMLNNEEIFMEGNYRYEFECGEDGMLETELTTIEANNPIKITIVGNNDLDIKSISQHDKYENRVERTVLSPLYNLSEIDKKAEEAKQIWMDSEIKQKYRR